MFNFFKKEKVESLGEYNRDNKSKNNDKLNIAKVVEELISLSAVSSSQTSIVVVESNQMDLLLTRIIALLDKDLSHRAAKRIVKTSGTFTTKLNNEQAMSLKEAKQVVDTSGTFTTKLNNEQALRLIESCKACGIILQVV